jgi:hypothetical protein
MLYALLLFINIIKEKTKAILDVSKIAGSVLNADATLKCIVTYHQNSGYNTEDS